ncbi:sigma-70 family RNA polymerase sigma factor [Nannocystis radixulma]|uniref:Sigma-70 family RNA polymerase sigma factor n=1 Tax=Nannocystis radixulma TaxID=2995305 RepID=A0ABT5BDS8_9BACT|nr:sigma-70 family RNA polymerase sigma factor [Nannocystis radixulma]MDC0672281.1 sigma-70 family RNA polymerase sigma factor [Nannocystis radixulma]
MTSDGPDHDLASLYARGREAWPDIDVDIAEFARFVAARLQAHAADRLDGAALYLVCACLAGDKRALAAFDQRYIVTLAQVLSRLERTGVSSEDVTQLLRIRFLFGEADRPPRIADYNGTSDLRAWLRVAAVRIGISLQRKHRREDPDGDEALSALADAAPSPELELMKEISRDEFAAALRAAVAGLEPRQRNLLRHQALDRMSIDRIAALYGVHRATAARWVAQARDALVAGVRRRLQARLAVAPERLDSLLLLIESRLDVSLRPLLAAE